MSVRLHIEIEGPLGPDDKEILTGATMILLALSQRYAEPEEAEPQPCGAMEYASEGGRLEATGMVCVSEVGHKGRHKYRSPVPAPGGGLN